MSTKKSTTATRKRDLTGWLQGRPSKKLASPAPADSESRVVSPSNVENAPPSPMVPPKRKRKTAKEAANTDQKSDQESAKSSPTKLSKSAKSKGQQSIFGFCSVQKTEKSLEENKAKAVQFYEDALKAVRSCKLFNWKQTLNGAKTLPESAFTDIESDFFKFAVFPNTAVQNGLLTNKKLVSEYSAWLDIISKGLVEDSSISKPILTTLPKISEIGDAATIFGQSLVITEFCQTFSNFLTDECFFSAAELAAAVTNGLNGYYAVTSHVLTTFLKCMFEFDVVEGHKCLNYRIENIQWNHKAASEVLKIVAGMSSEMDESILNGDVRSFLRGMKQRDNSRKNPKLSLPDELAAKFVSVDFYELVASDQMAIFDFLMNTVMDVPAFNAMFTDTCKEYPANFIALKEKKIEEITEKLKTGRAKEKQSLSSLRSACRNEIRAYQLHQKVNLLRKKLDLTNQQYLGSDRFHRKYYFCRRRSNFGIYAESVAPSPSASKTGTPCFKKDKLAAEIVKIANITYAPTIGSEFSAAQWFKISTLEEFDGLVDTLASKGVRESELLAALKEVRPKFSSARSRFQQITREKRDDEFRRSGSNDWTIVQSDLHKIVKRVSKTKFIHFSTTVDELYQNVDDIDSLEKFASAASNLLKSILPCAFPPMQPGLPYFRYSIVVNYVKASKSIAQIHLLSQLMLTEMRGDNVFLNKKCPRCSGVFSPNAKVASCIECFGFIHLKCVASYTEPNANLPLWKCENCGVKRAPESKESIVNNGEHDDNDDDEKSPEPVEDYIAGGRALRATRARDRAREPSQASTIPESKSRSQRAAATRSVYIDDSDDEDAYQKRKTPPKINVKTVLSEVQARYDELKEDYRVFKSLGAVRFVNLEGNESNIIKLGDDLHEYQSVAELERDIKALFVAAKAHFAHNSRKLDEVEAYMSQFIINSIEEDSTDESEESSDELTSDEAE